MFQIDWFIDALALQSHHLGADDGCMLFFFAPQSLVPVPLMAVE